MCCNKLSIMYKYGTFYAHICTIYDTWNSTYIHFEIMTFFDLRLLIFKRMSVSIQTLCNEGQHFTYSISYFTGNQLLGFGICILSSSYSTMVKTWRHHWYGSRRRVERPGEKFQRSIHPIIRQTLSEVSFLKSIICFYLFCTNLIFISAPWANFVKKPCRQYFNLTSSRNLISMRWTN